MALNEPLTEDAANAARMQFWQRVVFLITFLNYAMSHFSRKCYTNVKTNLEHAGVDKLILSQMDTAFMFTYAIGSFISGRLGDMFPQNVVIGVGLLGSTLCLGLIAIFQWTDVVNSNYPLGFFLFVLAQFTHGFFQSTGGPVNTSVMGAWWPKKGRGLIFGLWTCHQVRVHTRRRGGKKGAEGMERATPGVDGRFGPGGGEGGGVAQRLTRGALGPPGAVHWRHRRCSRHGGHDSPRLAVAVVRRAPQGRRRRRSRRLLPSAGHSSCLASPMAFGALSTFSSCPTVRRRWASRRTRTGRRARR